MDALAPLINKSALITGGSKGIGMGIAMAMAGERMAAGARGWGGVLQPLVRFQHGAHTRFNDGKADPLGRFWAGTYYEPKDARKADLYCLDCRPDNGNGGQPIVQLKAHNATAANGTAWSPDRHTLYWSDTGAHTICAWDWQAEANVLRRHRVFRQFAGKPAGWQPGSGRCCNPGSTSATPASANYGG